VDGDAKELKGQASKTVSKKNSAKTEVFIGLG
jgi:hypothetical protein